MLQESGVKPQYPSWESLCYTGEIGGLSFSFYRLHWGLFGPMIDNIKVMEDATDPTSLTEPFVIPLPGGGLSFHAIAEEPLTYPPISSVTFVVDEMSERASKANTEVKILLVLASSQLYITIGDYVMQVHEWLNSLQDELLATLEESYGPLPGYVERGPDHRVWVWIQDPQTMSLNEEEVPSEWPGRWSIRADGVKQIMEGMTKALLAAQGSAQGGTQVPN